MLDKKRAQDLENALKSGKTPEECNDSDLRSLLDLNELLTQQAYEDQEPDAEFKQRLLASIVAQRTEESKRMKLPKLAFPNLQLNLLQQRWSPVVAFVLLVAVVAGTIGFFPSDNKFRRLLIDEAYAQDNFIITPTEGDTTGVKSTTSFTITSQTDISLGDLRDNIKIFPQTEFDLSVAGERTFLLEPKTELEDGRVYTVTIDTEYTNSAGQLSERDYSWAFQVKDPFKVLHTIPGDLTAGVPRDTVIEFTFSHQNVEGMEEAFAITPHVDGRFETYGRTIVFIPNDNLEPATLYTVSLSDDVRVSGSEDKLLEPVSFTFETSSTTSGNYLSIEESMLEFASGDQVVIPVSVRNQNYGTIAATVYAFKSTEDFIDSLRERTEIPAWARASRAAHTIDTANLSEISSSEVSLQETDYQKFVPLPDDLMTGLYLVELEAGGQVSQVLVQITDLAVYSAVTATDTIVWVNDTSTRTAVSNARVTSLDGHLDEVTDSEGIVVFDGEAILEGVNNPWNVSDYLTVTAGNKLTVVQLGKSTDYYYFNSAYSYDEHWEYLYTDRAMYQLTDTVSYWGFVQSRDGSTPETVRVTLSALNYYSYNQDKIPLYEETLPVTQGSFTGSTSFTRLSPGTYALEMHQDDTVIGTRYIWVTEYEKPAYELNIEPEKLVGFATDSFTYGIGAAFFEGTPVANLKVNVTSTNSATISPTQSLTLDGDGKGSLTLQTKGQTCTLGATCSLVDYGSLSVRPALAEEGEIMSTVPKTIYNSRVTAEVNVERNDNQVITTSLDAFNIDLDKLVESGSYYNIQDNYRGSVAGGVSVTGQITEVTYTRVETGQIYDFINKVHRPTYRYESNSQVVETFSGTTAADGSFSFSYQGDEDKSYHVDIILQDSQGGQHALREISYADSRFRSWSDYDQVNIKRVKEANTFSLGETAEFVFQKNDEQIVPDEDDAFLFLKLQDGLMDYEVSDDSVYAFVFDQEEVPNVGVEGVYFDGQTYLLPRFSFRFSSSAKLDVSERELNLAISTDKEVYEPGEEVTLEIQVTDLNDNPVQSAVNVNLVDEAFYALQDENATPLTALYKDLSSGLAHVSETHKYRSLAGDFSAAEGGGCFLAGTKILLADGSEKDIEDIVVGDMILTRQSERSDKLVAARVAQTFVHDVDEYMILNDKIRVTPVHRMFVNYGWQVIGEAKVGDVLIDTEGELVRIDSIEWVREPVTVYNFEVENLHTYFADGVYVHNDKGGVREDFVDTALFEALTTNRNGQVSVTFELPDNITTWRVTAQAISPDLYAGVGVSPVKSTKPVFVDAVMGSEYLTADKPQIKVRAFGTALDDNAELDFTVSSESLELNEAFTESAYTSRYVSLGDLTGRVGSHDLLVSAETSEYSDAIKRSTQVVESRITHTEESLETITANTSLKDKADMSLVFSDASRGQYYPDLVRLHASSGGRADQLAASLVTGKLLNAYFSLETESSSSELLAYAESNGMIALLPYASGDLALTAKVAAADPSLVDAYALSSTLYEILDSQNSTNEEIAQALLGLAAIGEPVLIPLQNLNRLEDQSVTTRLFTALALAEIGDHENARDVYVELLRDYGEETDAYTRLKLTTDVETLEATSLTAVVAAILKDPNANKLWTYASTVHEDGIITPLEQAMYMNAVIPQLPVSEVSFELLIGDDSTTVDLSNGKTYLLRLTADQAKQASIGSVQGAVSLTTSRSVPSDGTNQSDLVSIKREYLSLAGQPISELKEGDLIEVRITPSFSGTALDGAYHITDLIPSGLAPITQPRRVTRTTTRVMYPYALQGQTAKFMYYKTTNNPSFSYYARVTAVGEYVAEPALIEYSNTPSIHSFSEEGTLTITR